MLRTDLALRDATLDDVPAFAALRESVGWAIHDWALRAVIGQPDARCLAVVDTDGTVAGVGSGIRYPPSLGFIGNMVVAEPYRRRGVGTAILDAVANWLTEAGCTRLELNATDEGRPLYEANGFESVGWSTTARIPRRTPLEGDPAIETRLATDADAARLAAYDLPRFGGDRSRILRVLLDDPECVTVVAERDGEVAGYGVVRPPEPRLGPLVADAPEVAAALLRAAFDLAPAADEMRLNLPPDNRSGAEWLGRLGVATERWGGRMARGPAVDGRGEAIYQMTVGPLG